MHITVANSHVFLRIKDHDVGVRPHRDRSLLGIETKQLGRVGGAHFDEAVERQFPLTDTLGVEHGDQGFEVGHAG